MDFQFAQERFLKVLKQKDIFLKLLVGMLCLNLLQFLERMMIKDKVILVPPTLSQEVWVMGQQTSASFLEEWALYLSSTLLNISSQTVDFQNQIVLRYVHPESAGALQKQLSEDLHYFKENNVATLFHPKAVHVTQKGSQGTVIVKGNLATFMGSKRIEDVDKTYILTFQTSRHTPQLSLLSFKEDSPQKPPG